MMIISKEQIIELHKQLIEETGGSHGTLRRRFARFRIQCAVSAF